MKLIIDIPESTYKVFKNLSRIIGILVYEKDILTLIKVVKKGIPLPQNATNGDMFLTTHPNVVATKLHKEGNLFDVVQLRTKGDTIPFAEIYIDWWNAPYKAESEK